jgi:hypothetical protein
MKTFAFELLSRSHDVVFSRLDDNSSPFPDLSSPLRIIIASKRLFYEALS